MKKIENQILSALERPCTASSLMSSIHGSDAQHESTESSLAPRVRKALGSLERRGLIQRVAPPWSSTVAPCFKITRQGTQQLA